MNDSIAKLVADMREACKADVSAFADRLEALAASRAAAHGFEIVEDKTMSEGFIKAVVRAAEPSASAEIAKWPQRWCPHIGGHGPPFICEVCNAEQKLIEALYANASAPPASIPVHEPDAEPIVTVFDDGAIDVYWTSANSKSLLHIKADKTHEYSTAPAAPQGQWPKPPIELNLARNGVAVCFKGRFEGWVFVLHVDGEHWTSAAKLTDETYAMLKANMLRYGAEQVMRDTTPHESVSKGEG